MLKISFWLRNPVGEQSSLEYITIDEPKKVLEDKLIGLYTCEVYLPETEKKHHLIYADNPIETLCFASEFAKGYLQVLINRGYVISEVESRETWKLEKKDPQVYLQEKISELKNNKNLSEEDKQKILGIMKESFEKIPHMKDKFNIPL